MQQHLDRSRAELRRLSYMVQSEVAILQGEFKNIQPRTSQSLEMKRTEWMNTQPGEDDRPVGTYPLVITSGTGQLYYDYNPWSFRHLDTAAKLLPHLSKRADRWIPTFEAVIASHHQLCLGDLIALMAKVLTPGQCDTICDQLQLTQGQVELPFTHFRQALYQQLREMFPTTRDVQVWVNFSSLKMMMSSTGWIR